MLLFVVSCADDLVHRVRIALFRFLGRCWHPTRAQAEPLKKMRISGGASSGGRRAMLSRAFACVTLSFMPPPAMLVPPAAAADLTVQLALASLIQTKYSVANIDGALFETLLEPSGSPAARRTGIDISEGEACRSRIRKLLQSASRPRTIVASIERLPQKLGRAGADEIERHAREAEERLAAVLEYDLANALKTDALGNRVTVMSPAELEYYHRALRSAQAEIDLVLRRFDQEDRQQALRLAIGPQPAAELAERRVAERDGLISEAILGLPDWRGTALTRGDLQVQLDNAWREDLAVGRTSLPAGGAE
jgi:hypothetical protein